MNYENFLETPISRGDVLYPGGRELLEQLYVEITAEKEFQRQCGRNDILPPVQRATYYQNGKKIKTGFVMKMLDLYLKAYPIKTDQEEQDSIILSYVMKHIWMRNR